MQFKSLLYGPLLIILPSLIGCGQAKTENRRTPPQSEIQEENPIQEQEPDESAPGEQEPEGSSEEDSLPEPIDPSPAEDDAQELVVGSSSCEAAFINSRIVVSQGKCMPKEVSESFYVDLESDRRITPIDVYEVKNARGENLVVYLFPDNAVRSWRALRPEALDGLPEEEPWDGEETKVLSILGPSLVKRLNQLKF